jgi:TonB family protein
MFATRVIATLRSLLGVGATVSCSSAAPRSEPAELNPAVIHIAPPPEIAATTPRKLPPHAGFIRSMLWYPAPAVRLGMSGRVLVEFTLDTTGIVASAKVVAADAPQLLQGSALEFVRNSKFNIASADFNRADSAPFRVSILYCVATCGELVPFPGSQGLTITNSLGTPLGRPGGSVNNK